jgi:hypothetical protein
VRLAVVLALAAAACSSEPGDADLIAAARANLEWSKARLAITVDAKVTIDDVRIVERRKATTISVLAMPELRGWPVAVSVAFHADDNPGREVAAREQRVDFLVFRDNQLDALPANERDALASDRYPRARGGWDAWHCDLDGSEGCHVHLAP